MYKVKPGSERSCGFSTVLRTGTLTETSTNQMEEEDLKGNFTNPWHIQRSFRRVCQSRPPMEFLNSMLAN